MQRFFLLFWSLGLLVGGAMPAQAQTSGEQTATARLAWGTYAELTDANGSTRKVPTFKGAYHGPGDAVGTLTLRVPGTVANGSVRDAVYEAFPAADAALLRSATLPASPAIRVRVGTEARQPYSYVLVQPARRNPQTGQAERLVSFTYAYQAGAGKVAARTMARTHASASVLRQGDWFKIGVPTSGIYKLDRAALSSLGLPVGSIDPHRIQVYGNATGVLPQANAAPRPEDLVENNIALVGDNNDNVFDNSEYFLFYAPGPHVWAVDSTNRVPSGFRHVNNVYADTAYYFVTVGATNGRRVPATATPAGTPSGAPITTFTDRRFYEHDLTNLLHSGRRWLGEQFVSGTSQDFNFSSDGQPALTDLVPGSPVRLRVAVAAASLGSSYFQASLNGAPLPGILPITAISTLAFTAVANTYTGDLTTTLASTAEPRVTLSYTSSASNATTAGYLDYLELQVQRQLRLSASSLEFRSPLALRGAGSVGTYALDNASGAQVWEVTNPRRPRAQPLAGTSFVAYTDSVREYVAFQPTGSFPTPRLFAKVANQNLHALNLAGDLDLVIVTYPAFRRQAERLAQHRRDYNGMKVEVVTTKEIFNEYASGAQDVTAIRDLMKQVYDRNPSPAARRNYLLLFGDASYDYKASPFNNRDLEPNWWKNARRPFAFDTNVNADLYNQNFVPTYESRESFLPVDGGRDYADGRASYASEDYYGLLDDNEGNWDEFGSGTYESCDIGIGRIPVRPPRGQATNDDQARQVVDKIIAYDATASFGKWRNRMTLTADDNDPNIGMAFTIESETQFAPTIQAAEPAYNIKKAYLDLFPQQSVAAGQRSPAAEAAINSALDQGSLLIGYTGHGGPEALADEKIITKASLLALTNQNRLTFFVTGTCDLSTYDNPDYTSAGEAVLTDNLNAGAVGLFTTTRVVYSYQNTQLVNAFYSQVLSRNAAGDLPYIGDASRMAKISAGQGGDLNNRNYTLLADPTTRLAYPRQRVLIDSINGRKVVSLQVSLDTLKALSKARISGHIENHNALNTSFNGTADITIFDKATSVNTLGDENGAIVPVQVQENIVYGGQASVRAGRFSVNFIVPKDISYSVGLGKISLYAADYTNKVDAQGYQLVPIGGAALNAAGDVTPPEVRLFMDDDSFVSGGLTDVNTLLLGKLFDLSGINTSNAGVGHEITATIDNDPTKLVVVNDSYTAAVDDFTRGQLRYNYKSLAPGPHVLRVKAWDTHNNSGEGTVEFIVAQKASLALDHVLNYPNPFSNITTFHFDHNRANQELEVQVQIFTVSGKLVKTLHADVMASTAHNQSISWNGRDDYDDQLARGVYVYRISVRSASDSQQVSKFEKLVLLN